MSYNILHISPHLGGGVGTVLRNYLKKDKKNNHTIFCLDYINKNSKEFLKNQKIEFIENLRYSHKIILKKIKNIDIVLIHWWNHPLLYEFLIKNILPKSRVIIWSHVSGQKAPQIFNKHLFDYADKFLFTTPISFLTNTAQNYNYKNKLSYIWATSGLENLKNVKKKKEKNFNIGYIGTLDFSKLHKNFIKLCSKINIPNVKFIVCGDGCDKETLIQQATSLGIADKFEFTGFIDNINPYLERMDIFAYPLNRNHYGTCDQVLAEAMACGIIPIVFNNNMENHIVHNMYNGIVVDNENDYINSIKMLYNNKSFYNLLSKNAQEEAFRRFSLEDMITKWQNLFNEILKYKKTSKSWLGRYKGKEVEPNQIFLESIGEYSEVFENNNISDINTFLNKYNGFNSKTKGSIHHYISFFKDHKLEQWSSIN